MARRSDIDWEAIERAYRLAQRSNKQLAHEFGVQASSIGRRAEKYGWIRDKAEEVLTRAANLLVKEAAAAVTGNATQGNANATPSELEVKAAARATADVILGHRVGLQRMSRLRDSMMAELQLASLPDGVDLLERLVDALDNPEPDAAKRASTRQDLLAKAIALPTRVESLRKLAEVDERIRRGEREAFGIGAGERGGEGGARVVIVPAKDIED